MALNFGTTFTRYVAFMPIISVLFLMSTLVTGELFRHGRRGHHVFHHRIARAVDQRNDTNVTISLSKSISVGSNVHQQDITRPFTIVSGTPTATAKPLFDCTSNNDTSVQPGNVTYRALCNVDFPGQDIFPFLLVPSLEDCISACDTYNNMLTTGTPPCLGVVFVGGRIGSLNDCYRKYGTAGATSGTVPMVAAVTSVIVASVDTASKSTITGSLVRSFSVFSSPGAAPTATAPSTNTDSSMTTTTLSHAQVPYLTPDDQSPSASTTSPSSSTTPTSVLSSSTVSSSSKSADQVTYGSGVSIIRPTVVSTKLLGPSSSKPSTEWVNHTFPSPANLHWTLSPTTVNMTLVTGYGIAPDTGTITSNKVYNASLSPLSGTPHLSRDCGKGGLLGGQHLFIFCDTASFTSANSDQNGDLTSFVSSSVAIDVDMNGLIGQPLILEDGVGQWSDDVGRLRGFAPMTIGEEAFNKQMAGKGYRYAIWPRSSLIPLDKDSAIIYANLVYDRVDMSTQSADLTYFGNTLLRVTAGDAFGPNAKREAKLLFNKDEVAWGSTGGLRSWGTSGIGGTDGKVYLFGKADQGVLVGRCDPSSLADRSKYEYWTGESWSSNMPSEDSKAHILDTPIMDFDLFYSPRHLTFIMVYMTTYADNTLYYRYLNSPSAILPPYAPGGIDSNDFAENIVRLPWSAEQVLYRVPTPAKSYAYAGSVHQGYFGTDDVMTGGTKMLISWTANTGLDAAVSDGGYALMTAVVDFN